MSEPSSNKLHLIDPSLIQHPLLLFSAELYPARWSVPLTKANIQEEHGRQHAEINAAKILASMAHAPDEASRPKVRWE